MHIKQILNKKRKNKYLPPRSASQTLAEVDIGIIGVAAFCSQWTAV
jgi:hypothetical protein